MRSFLSPYGDGTDEMVYDLTHDLFSPPYGEDSLSHGLRRASSPERGSLVQGRWQLARSA